MGEFDRLNDKLDTYIEEQLRVQERLAVATDHLTTLVERHETNFLHLKWLVQALAWIVSIVSALLAVKAWPWYKLP